MTDELQKARAAYDEKARLVAWCPEHGRAYTMGVSE